MLALRRQYMVMKSETEKNKMKMMEPIPEDEDQVIGEQTLL